jgi:hypothetical protein
MAVIRIPNLPMGALVDDKGVATDDELTFRQALVTNLQKLFGDEGMVAPSQTNKLADPDPNENFHIRQIQNNRLPNPITGAPDQYTCGFGRFLYDATNNRILVSIDVGGGVPGFAEVNLTMPPLVPPV